MKRGHRGAEARRRGGEGWREEEFHTELTKLTEGEFRILNVGLKRKREMKRESFTTIIIQYLIFFKNIFYMFYLIMQILDNCFRYHNNSVFISLARMDCYYFS